MKSNSNNFLITFAIFFIIFKTFNISPILYLIFFIVGWGLFISNFWLNKNKNFFNTLLSINTGIFVAYAFNLWTEGKFKFDKFELISIGIIAICIFLSFITKIYLEMVYKTTPNTTENITKIFPKRVHDIEKICQYIDYVNIVGIDSRWGTGKTFIVDKLKEKLDNEYETIEIDLLTCNLNELQTTLLTRLEDILYKNNIMPRFANRIKNDIANTSALSKFKDIGNLLFDSNYSNSQLFKEFLNELSKLDKKILLIFEDIDRITDKKVIIEVFGIAEKLAHSNLKVIYQYDERILKELEFDNVFLEKYIPFKISLTDIHAKEIIKFELEQHEYSNLKFEDFSYLWNMQNRFNSQGDKDIAKRFNTTFPIDYFPIRIIKNMIIEIDLVLKNTIIEYENDKDIKEIIISFYVLKHLVPKYYNKISIDTSILNSLYFIDSDKKKYSISDFISKINQKDQTYITNLINIEENTDTYRLLNLLNYQFIEFDSMSHLDNNTRLNRISNAKHYNDKIDKIYRNLKYIGTPALTDMESAVDGFIKDVLQKDIKDQKDAFINFNEKISTLDTHIDNQTTIYNGTSEIFSIFQSFQIVNKDPEASLKLIVFYFECLDVKKLNDDVITCLNFCDFETTKLFYKIIYYVSKLEVISNFEDSPRFIVFLKNCMSAISRFGISDSRILEEFNDVLKINTLDKQKQLLNKLMEHFKDKQTKYQQVLKSSKFMDDLNCIICFLEKMYEVVHCEKNSIYFNQTDVSSEDITTDLENNSMFYDLEKRIKNDDENSEDIINKMEESYHNNELTLIQFQLLLNELTKKTTSV